MEAIMTNQQFEAFVRLATAWIRKCKTEEEINEVAKEIEEAAKGYSKDEKKASGDTAK